MVNFNGAIVSEDANILVQNRGFLYGDAVFETLKIVDGKILFLEDHYFRLMSSMRIVRMEIPLNFTMEFFESQILSLVQEKKYADSARVRITVYRNDGGNYLPNVNTVSYIIKAEPLADKWYGEGKNVYEVE